MLCVLPARVYLHTITVDYLIRIILACVRADSARRRCSVMCDVCYIRAAQNAIATRARRSLNVECITHDARAHEQNIHHNSTHTDTHTANIRVLARTSTNLLPNFITIRFRNPSVCPFMAVGY